VEVLTSATHVRTSRHTRSFRSCRNSTGAPQALIDRGRICFEEGKLGFRLVHRLWLARQRSRAARDLRKRPQRSFRTRAPERRGP